MEFLEYLEQLLECQYLSDLPYAAADDSKLQQVRALPLAQFSAMEVAEGAAYITGRRQEYASPQEALEAIITRLKSNRKPRDE